uniref:DNA-binding protein n=1 Tax=Siphoviridae sp. ctoMB99 TaxID=2826459 RepID=A0A8S5MZ59_9CAUD|nr:MAG TPA: DNA-binding protein [Siphoviridae sp. ctoMB99]
MISEDRRTKNLVLFLNFNVFLHMRLRHERFDTDRHGVTLHRIIFDLVDKLGRVESPQRTSANYPFIAISFLHPNIFGSVRE